MYLSKSSSSTKPEFHNSSSASVDLRFLKARAWLLTKAPAELENYRLDPALSHLHF